MKALIIAVLLSFGIAAPSHAQSVKLTKIPPKKAEVKPKRATASSAKPKAKSKPKTKAKPKTPAKPKKPARATIKSSGSTLGAKSKTNLPVKAAGEAQKKKESQFKRRKRTTKPK